MKVGSLVECVTHTYSPGGEAFTAAKMLGIDVKPIYYEQKLTVRTIQMIGHMVSVTFEEIINVQAPNGKETSYNGKYFREIEFPPSLENELNEILSTPVKIEEYEYV